MAVQGAVYFLRDTMAPPYFKFYTDDWLGGLICTHDMQTQGIFINLCARMWKADGYLPHDEEDLARILRCDKQVLSNCLVLLIRDGIVCLSQDKKLFVKFILSQIEEMKNISVKRAEAGSKGGKISKRQPISNCLHPDTDTEPDTDLPPIPPKVRKLGRLSEVEKRRIRVKENSPEMVRIGKWFGRRSSTHWTIYEAEALSQIDLVDEDVDLMEKYYKSGYECLRKSVETLLNNWSGELDRATSHLSATKKVAPANKPQVFSGLVVVRTDKPQSQQVMVIEGTSPAKAREMAEKIAENMRRTYTGNWIIQEDVE